MPPRPAPKGLPAAAVMRHHALRNALLPTLTQIAELLPALVAGAVVVEVVFALPGMGRLLARGRCRPRLPRAGGRGAAHGCGPAAGPAPGRPPVISGPTPASVGRPDLAFSGSLGRSGWRCCWLGVLLLVAAWRQCCPCPTRPPCPIWPILATPPLGAGRHWLGTDPQGRDVLSVLLFGARTAVLLTLPAALLAALLGALAGGGGRLLGQQPAGCRCPTGCWRGGLLWWVAGLPVPMAGLAVAG